MGCESVGWGGSRGTDVAHEGDNPYVMWYPSRAMVTRGGYDGPLGRCDGSLVAVRNSAVSLKRKAQCTSLSLYF
jgi:hypothetical protein